MKRSFSRSDALLLAFTLGSLFPALIASRTLLAAAALLLQVRNAQLAALAIFVNNMVAMSLVLLTSILLVRFSWAWGFDSAAVKRNAIPCSILIATAIFAASLIIRSSYVSPVLFTLPHFWLEYSAIAFAAHSGLSGSIKSIAAAVLLLALAALAEAWVALLFG